MVESKISDDHMPMCSARLLQLRGSISTRNIIFSEYFSHELSIDY